MALMEICVGALAGYIATRFFDPELLKPNAEWMRFIAGSGAVLLTFLAGAELDPVSVRKKIKEVSVVGLIGFFAPFIGCSALAYFVLGWDPRASLLGGIALSTTSMAVVYAVMLEYGFNKTEYGKGILGACFVNDLGTVIALGLIFAPFTYRTIIFVAACIVALFRPAAADGASYAHIRQPHRRHPHQMDRVRSLRPRRARALGRQRAGPSRLHRGHGARRERGAGRVLHPAAADAHHRLSHAASISFAPGSWFRYRR